MPIREFACDSCGHQFEELVLSKRDERGLSCPRCRRRKLTALFSVFGVSGAEKRVSTSSKSCGGCHSHNCSTCN